MAYTFREWLHDGSQSNNIPFWAITLLGYANTPTLKFHGTGDISTLKGNVAFQDAVDSLTATVSNGSNFTGDYDTNGYIQFPNGFIMQWGKRNSAGNTSFPIKFPNKAFLVLAGNADSQGALVDNAFGYVVNNATFYIATKASNTGSVLGFATAWIAIGV